MKKVSLLTIILLVSLIMFRNNILIFFNNVYNLFLEKNNIRDAEILILEEKVRYLENEYDKLNNLKNKLPMYAKYNYFISRIISRENYFYNAEILIEGGKTNGIKDGMAVINEFGLIGVVQSVNDNISKVKLLQNIENLSVNINGYYGKLVFDSEKFIVKDISHDSVINLNDEVYTSTLGNIKEKIYIGKVIEVNDGIIEKQIVISSKVDFNNLNYLLVVGDLWHFIYLIFF